jgi:hypothetical protein
METHIRRDGDRVWIEGVVSWSFGERASSIHAAQASAMAAIGESVSYDHLVGVSGLAFRMQLSKHGFCPSSPHPACGFRCLTRSSQALPVNIRVFELKPESGCTISKIRGAVVESIDRGVPVEYGNEEDGLIIGYQKRGEEWLCLHPFRKDGESYYVETGEPWGVAVFTDRKSDMPSPNKMAIEALEQAVEMARADGAGEYFLGFRAWEEYISRLRALDAADDGMRKDAMLGNAWIYDCLVQHRRSASSYLRTIAGEFEIDAAHQLTSIADRYSRISDQVLTDPNHRAISIAPYPFTLQDGETWSSAMRAEQVTRLEDAAKLEHEAIRLIEHAIPMLVSS